MKIKKIELIKNLGSFSDFKWDVEVPEFHDKRNIFYGMNGVGKTTLSELLRSISQGRATLDYEKKAKNPKFKIALDNLLSINSLGSDFSNIKVFNKEFVNDNVFCSGGANPIIHLGNENIEFQAQLDELKKKKENKQQEIDNEKKQYQILEKSYESRLTEKAKVIKEVLSIPTYNKIKIENLLNSTHFQKKQLSEEDLETNKIQSKQTIKSIISEKIVFDHSIYENYYNQVKQIIARSVVNDTIDKLQGEIEQWVKQGVVLHEGEETCYFCNNPISSEYKEKLKKHFNQEYNSLSQAIETIINQKIGESFYFIDGSLLYDEFVQDYIKYKEGIQKEARQIQVWVDQIREQLILKKDQMSESLLLEEVLYDFSSLQGLVSKINSLIDQHNNKTNNFTKEVQSSQDLVEIHYASELYDTYIQEKKNLKDLKEKIDYIDGELYNLTNQISQLTIQSKPEGNALKAINTYITYILGRDDIQLVLAENGYKIVRGPEKQEFNPSEGEKTTIGFAYFLAKLYDQNTTPTDIIVFDDPITSLDEALLYRFYSIILSLKNYQVFLLTHHYSFLKKFIGGLKKEDVSYYRIKKNQGNSEIDLLEEEFFKYQSEYHFLFKTLYNFWQDSDKKLTIEDAYNYANMIRKLIEVFGSIHAPKAQDIAGKLKKCLNKAKLEETEQYNLIYKFINDYSHLNSIDAVESFDVSIYMQSLPQVVKSVMTMIQNIDNDHFAEMINC